MTASVFQAIEFILQVVVGLYLLLLLLRLVLPLVGANFHNPLAQGILKATSPLVVPLRRLLPPIGRADTATIVVALAIQYLLLLVLAALSGTQPGIVVLTVAAVFELLFLVIKLFLYAILIRIVISWISPGQYNPATEIIASLTDPILRPCRRLIPPMGGFDISPMFAMLALGVAMILLGGVRNSVMLLVL